MRELKLTSSTEASLADVSRSVLQDVKKEKKMNVTYGQNFCGWSEKLSRIGLSLKTYLESCVSLRTKCVLTSKIKATELGFLILKLRLSVRRTEENGFFLWRTPTAHCNRGAMKRETFLKKMEQGMPLSLNDQVINLYPTPIAHDSHVVSTTDYKRHSPPLGCYAGGRLNPEWVEALMGFPISWTELT